MNGQLVLRIARRELEMMGNTYLSWDEDPKVIQLDLVDPGPVIVEFEIQNTEFWYFCDMGVIDIPGIMGATGVSYLDIKSAEGHVRYDANYGAAPTILDGIRHTTWLKIEAGPPVGGTYTQSRLPLPFLIFTIAN